jgi:hypothetical protein
MNSTSRWQIATGSMVLLLMMPVLAIAGDASAGDGQNIQVYVPSELRFRIEVYDPVVKIRFGELVEAGSTTPVWYAAYKRLQRYDLFSFQELSDWCTPEFIKKNQLTQSFVEANKRSFKKEESPSALASALWAVYVEMSGRHLCFLVTYDSGFLEKVPTGPAGLRGGLSTYLFELHDGRWKNQTLDEFGAARYLPVADREQMAAIVGSGGGLVDLKSRGLKPLPSGR